MGLIPRRRKVLDALGALMEWPKRLSLRILDGVARGQRVQIVHVAQLRARNRRHDDSRGTRASTP